MPFFAATAYELAQARRVNRFLAWMPRFRVGPASRARRVNRFMHFFHRWFGPRPGAVWVQNRRVSYGGHSVDVRILRPPGPCRGALLDVHGGGWQVGEAALNDDVNMAIVRATGMAVVGVDYRLAIERPIADGLQDCEAAANWLISKAPDEFGCDRLFIGGDSAGAHLAVVTLLRLRDQGRARLFRGAVLFYGLYDFGGTPSARAAGSDCLFLHGPGIMTGLRRLTPGLTDEQRRSSELSPINADLSALPPALLIVGELDPLLDDSVLLAERWAAAAEDAGDVELLRVPESPHAFNRFRTRLAQRVNAVAQDWMRQR
jgi:acetyl esterase/lipase